MASKWGSTFGGSSSGGKWGSWGGSDSSGEQDPYSPESLQKQIQNAQTRIGAVGGEINPDDRNWFEKATNLPEKQNMFFDVLDLLGRPGQAVTNLISDQMNNTGRSAGESLYRGFSGQNKVTGADIVGDLGAENKVGKFAGGLAVDILTDPLNLIPGKAFATAAQTAGKGLKAGVNALEKVDALAPVVRGTKDSLGNIFNPTYRWEETLTGGKSDKLKNLNQETINFIRFNTEERLKNVADTAKSAGGIDTGIDVGRIMEAPLKQFDEAGNPLERPIRELPTNPKTQQAAQRLMESNAEIRQMAEEAGINIKELEGYMTHILSAEERKARKLNKPIQVDRGNFGNGQPNDEILNKRLLKGSAEDVNERLGRNYFEPNAYFATAMGQKRLTEYIGAMSFRRKVLSDPDFAVKHEDWMQLGPNQVKINTKDYKFMSDDAAEQLGLADDIGGEYVVTKGVKQALDRYQKLTTDEGVKSFLKAFDTVQSAWKRMTLFSVGYHTRNAMGGVFNNWVGGMNAAEISKYTPSAAKEVADAITGKESALYREYRQQGLGSTNLSQVEYARAGEDPEKAIQKTIKERSRSTGGQIVTRLNPLRAFETSREAGDIIDQTNRFALYKWAKDKGMSPEQAANKVREVQYDYTKLTTIEREGFARAIPFYRWMRNNIPFQLRQFINNPKKYYLANEARLNAQDTVGINEENAPEWMKQQFAYPVSGDGGKGKFLSLGLPLGDLMKLSSPLKTLVDSGTPLVKIPAEYALNYNTFRGKPIEKFEGQTKQFVGGGELPIKAAYALEQATGQIGRGLSSYLQKPGQEDQDTKFRLPSLGISSILKDYDTEQATKFQLLDELNRLRDYIQFLEQQTGKPVPTLPELKKEGRLF